MLVDNAVPGESGTGRPRRHRSAARFAGRMSPAAP